VAGQKQTDALVEAMNALGYQAVNLSERELSHGYEAFRERRAKASFSFVSANVVWQDTGEPVADPTAVRKVAVRDGAKVREVRLGFIGLAKHNPAFLKEGPGGRSIVTVDPLAAAEKYVPVLKKKADVIVALVSLDLDQARQLARKAGAIDLVLGARGGAQTRTDDFPEDSMVGSTRILYIGDQGKNLGEVRLFFDASGRIAGTQRNIVGLSREWPEDAILARLTQTTREAVNDYNKTQAEAANPFAAPAPGSAHEALYTGSDRCAPCHEREFAAWSRSGHARAFATLVKASQDFNPRCVGCHTVGYGQPRGFVDVRATPDLVNVGCESCHGPSSRHPDVVLKGYGRTDTSSCGTCHTHENSPDYNPAEYIPKIKHWKDAAQAAR
jgi:hypothetical protein